MIFILVSVSTAHRCCLAGVVNLGQHVCVCVCFVNDWPVALRPGEACFGQSPACSPCRPDMVHGKLSACIHVCMMWLFAVPR